MRLPSKTEYVFLTDESEFLGRVLVVAFSVSFLIAYTQKSWSVFVFSKKFWIFLQGLAWQFLNLLNFFKNRQDGEGKRFFLYQKSRLKEAQAAA